MHLLQELVSFVNVNGTGNPARNKVLAVIFSASPVVEPLFSFLLIQDLDI
jgi:hypothetical protein